MCYLFSYLENLCHIGFSLKGVIPELRDSEEHNHQPKSVGNSRKGVMQGNVGIWFDCSQNSMVVSAFERVT